MNAAEDEERAGRGEIDLDRLAGLLGAGIEVERTVWDVGRTFVDVYELKLPATAPPAAAQLVYGLYNGDSGQRLPVTGANAGTTDQAWVQLGTVEIKP